jgi:hypothetical protein
MAYTTYKNGDFGDGANDIAINHVDDSLWIEVGVRASN